MLAQNENMFGALRLVTVQKGLDPRDFALVPFGGAGPLHGNAMAMLAGCYPVIVPPTPVLSALGFLYSDVKNEFAQTFVRTIDDADRSQIGDILTKLGRDARAWLREEGIEESRQRLNYEAVSAISARVMSFRSKSTMTGWAAAGSKTSPDTLAWRTSAFMAPSSINR